MTTSLVRIDEELGLILDADLREQYAIDEHTQMVVVADEDGIFLKPIRFAADELVAALTPRIMAEHAETLRKLAL